MADEIPIAALAEWPVFRLGDIALKIGSGATPRGGEETYLAKRARFALVRSQNVFDRRFDTTGLAFVSDEQAKRLNGVALRPGDLLLNITGDGVTFSRVCAVPQEILPACVNQHVAIIRVDPTVADPGYVLAYLTHPLVKPYIESFNAGGSRRAITKGHIESFQLALPPLPEQRAIARILGALDDKIDLNRQMNQTLEQIAATLFKSWFIDFDPVRAKAERRQPEGMDAETAALFPDRLVESELGAIPEGWRSATVSEVAGLNTWTLGKNDELDQIEYVDISAVTRGDIGSIQVFARGAEPSRARRRLRHGDTVLSTVRPDRGAHFLSLNPGPNLIASTGFAVVSPFKVPWSIMYSALTRDEVSAYLGHVADGGAYPAIRPELIGSLTLTLPPESALLDTFHAICGPLYERAALNRQQSVTLAEIRDTLLPRLLSGELRVPTDLLNEEPNIMVQPSVDHLVQSAF